MRLSIVVINYNYERFLAQAIECALAVRWDDKEVIVVDDGSTDGSADILQRFAGQVTATLVKPNGGQNSAANAGFERSTGDVVMFLDSDDTLFPDVAKHVMAAFDEQVSKVQFGLYKIDPAGRRIAPAWPAFDERHTPEWVRRSVAQTGYYATPPTSGIAWSRRFLSAVCPLPVRPPGKTGRWGLWFDDYLSMLAPFFGDVVSLPTALGNYRLHGTNDTGGRAFSPELVAAVCVEETQRAFAVNTLLEQRLLRQPVDIELYARHMKHRLIYRCLLGEQYPIARAWARCTRASAARCCETTPALAARSCAWPGGARCRWRRARTRFGSRACNKIHRRVPSCSSSCGASESRAGCEARVRIRDLRNTSDTIDETDLCIVGSGPAGMAIAQHFAGGRRRVLIVESGDREERPEIQAQNEVESVGAPRQPDQALVRTRIFGGTSHVWTGRCGELDALDYEERPWVPLSGWPITRGDLAPFLLRAAEHLGLAPVLYDAALSARLGALPRQWTPLSDQVEPCAWQFSQDPRDPTQSFRSACSLDNRPSHNIDLLLNATVTRLNLDPAGQRVESIEVASLTGRRHTLRARAFVLCAGAIETPRLLLASRSVVPEGVGNRHDLVGRYLMDHPRFRLGHFEPKTAGPMLLRFGQQRLALPHGVRQFLPGLRISPVLQRDEALLNCAAWVRQDHAEDDPWDALRRLRQSGSGLLSRRRDLEAVIFQPRLLARQLRRRVLAAQPVVHKVTRLDLMCDVEQAPDPSSRLTLSERRDALEVPLARIDWRIGDAERRTLRRFGRATAEAFARMGFRAPLLSEAVRSGRFDAGDLIDVAHPSGTTRMASDPTRGVVDANCRVHGVDRLYIAGAAVFPTNGHVNPTLTIVALSLRLAAWLEQFAAWT